MARPFFRSSLLVLSLVFLCGVYPGHAQTTPCATGTLVVFAAASLTAPYTAISTRLMAQCSGLRIISHFNGSQTLRTQLEQGAQADIFAAANAIQMELALRSQVVQAPIQVFARNRLTIIVPHDNPGQVTTFRDLAKPGLHLVLAGPQVPVGRYSRQALDAAQKAHGQDFAPQVLRNLVSAEHNVKQVVVKVRLGEADAGIVYVSDVTPSLHDAVRMIPIPEAYNPIATYPLALTTEVQNRHAAETFITFVLSEQGQNILQAYNFLPATE